MPLKKKQRQWPFTDCRPWLKLNLACFVISMPGYSQGQVVMHNFCNISYTVYGSLLLSQLIYVYASTTHTWGRHLQKDQT